MTLFLDNIVVKKSPLYLRHLSLLLFNTELELQTYRMGSFWGLVSDYDTVKSTVSDLKLSLRFFNITVKIRF